MLDRRTLLVTAAAPIAALPLPAGGAAHPDAELLAAWEEYRHHYRRFTSIPERVGGRLNPAYEACSMAMDAALDRMAEIPARTPAGVVAKLRYLFTVHGMGEVDAVIDGGEPPGVEYLDFNETMFLRLIGEVEAMGVRHG